MNKLYDDKVGVEGGQPINATTPAEATQVVYFDIPGLPQGYAERKVREWEKFIARIEHRAPREVVLAAAQPGQVDAAEDEREVDAGSGAHDKGVPEAQATQASQEGTIEGKVAPHTPADTQDEVLKKADAKEVPAQDKSEQVAQDDDCGANGHDSELDHAAKRAEQSGSGVAALEDELHLDGHDRLGERPAQAATLMGGQKSLTPDGHVLGVFKKSKSSWLAKSAPRVQAFQFELLLE